MSFPALKWQSSRASLLTGINLLLASVVPLDLANHFIGVFQKMLGSPFRVFSLLFRYRQCMSFPALKWQSSRASLLTGINLLLASVVPLDLANHFIGVFQKMLGSPFRALSI